MSEVLYENEVEVQGVIVHKFSTDKITILTVSTGRATAIANYPKVVCFGEQKKIADKFNLRDHVSVKGNVQSSVRSREGRRFVIQGIYADEISDTPRMMESAFGIKTGAFEAPVNKVKIAGEVVSVTAPTDNILRIIVRTVKNGRRSNVQAFYFTNQAKRLADEIMKGDNVCLLGTIQTTKKERTEEGKDPETVHYENVVIQNLKRKVVEQ